MAERINPTNPTIPNKPISIEQQEYEEIYHTVAPGETVWSIAHDLGISVEELMAMNREIRNPVDLEPGVCVKIHE